MVEPNICQDHDFIIKDQIKFCQNNRTNDHIDWRVVINKHIKNDFNSLLHEGFFTKLENKGIN